MYSFCFTIPLMSWMNRGFESLNALFPTSINDYTVFDCPIVTAAGSSHQQEGTREGKEKCGNGNFRFSVWLSWMCDSVSSLWLFFVLICVEAILGVLMSECKLIPLLLWGVTVYNKVLPFRSPDIKTSLLFRPPYMVPNILLNCNWLSLLKPLLIAPKGSLISRTSLYLLVTKYGMT